MDALLSRIGELAIFLICAQTLIHFRAKDSYEKYIKLLVSMMLLLLVMEPFIAFFSGTGSVSFVERIDVYEDKLLELMESPVIQMEDMEILMQDLTESYLKEGAEYAQENGMVGEAAGEEGTRAEVTEQGTAATPVNITIEKIEVGGSNGQHKENP